MTIVKTYTKSWAKAYKKESKFINSLLPKAKAKLYHIGATAVKRAAARPVIDIMLTVADISFVTEEIMKGAGYAATDTVFGASAVYEKAGDGVSYRVLVYSDEDNAAKTHLDVCEYLAQNKKERKAYSRKKLQFTGVDNYDAAMAEYKSRLVAKIVRTTIKMKSRTLFIPVSTFGGLVLGGLIGSFASSAFIGGTIGILAGFIVGFVLSIVMAKRGKSAMAPERVKPAMVVSESPVAPEAEEKKVEDGTENTPAENEGNA